MVRGGGCTSLAVICETVADMKLLTARAAGVLADTINDANSTRKVYLLAAGLAVLGLALIAITVWFWRSTRHDPELLAPLEVLGGRKFRKLEGNEQRQVLEESRPNDVKPLQWGVERGAAADDPVVTVSAFDGALVVADSALIVAGTSVAETEADPHSDLDSILAAAGAVVPGRPVAAEAASSNGRPAEPAIEDAPADGPAADAAIAGPTASEPGVLAAAVAVADDAAATGDADEDGRPGSGSPAAPAAEREPAPAASPEPEVMPLLIVPVDHDLRPSVSRAVDPVGTRDPLVELGERPDVVADDEDPDDAEGLDEGFDDGFSDHSAEDRDDEVAGLGEFESEGGDDDDVDASASIDPLLRMFDRNDT